MYEIILSKKAVKYLDKLEEHTRSVILKALDKLRIRPEHYLTRLVGEKVYKLRVGDYRVIVDLDNKQLLVLVVAIGHRKNIYS